MQFGYRRFWIETVATKSPTVTARTSMLPSTGSIITTLSYIGATLGKYNLVGRSSIRLDGRGGDGERVGGRAVGLGAAVVEQPSMVVIGVERQDGWIELARVVDEVADAIEHGVVGVGREGRVVGGDGDADRPVGRRGRGRAELRRGAALGAVRGEPEAQAGRAVGIAVGLDEGAVEGVDVGPQRRARGDGR